MVIRSEGASQAGMSMRVMASPVCLENRIKLKHGTIWQTMSGEPTLRPGEGGARSRLWQRTDRGQSTALSSLRPPYPHPCYCRFGPRFPVIFRILTDRFAFRFAVQCPSFAPAYPSADHQLLALWSSRTMSMIRSWVIAPAEASTLTTTSFTSDVLLILRAQTWLPPW